MGVGVLMAACGDERSSHAAGARVPQYGVRDSSGVSIAENPRPWPDSRLGWTVSTDPLISIGTAGGEAAFQLHRVEDAARLADGRIVVANGGSLELLVFDAEGAHIGSWGGEGEGPGEFEGLNLVRPWAGDSILAADPEQGRISIFDGEGNHGRTAVLQNPGGEGLLATVADAVQSPGPVGGTIPDALIGVLPGGTLFTWDFGNYATVGFGRRDHSYALRTVDGDTRISLGKHPGPLTYTENYSVGGGFAFIPLRHPFGQTTHVGVWGDLAVIGRTETYELRGFRSDGSLARIVRRDHEPGTPTRAEQDAYFRELVADYSEERRRRVAEVAANVPLVDAFPAFGAILGDAMGHLWVAEFKRPGDESPGTLWTVFDGEGLALGFVETPEGITVYEIGEDYVLGKATDELGLEYVKVWGLTRRE